MLAALQANGNLHGAQLKSDKSIDRGMLILITPHILRDI